MTTVSGNRITAQRAEEQLGTLDELLRERTGLLSTLDRVAALRTTASLIRESVGSHTGFVAELEGTDHAVIRWTSGMRTGALRDLTVPVGQGMGGRVLALGKPVRVVDYVRAPTITHQFDAQVRHEGLASVIAVPVVDPYTRRIVAIGYAAQRESAAFGDDAIRTMEDLAARAGTALHLADLAGAGQQTAVSAERERMRTALHDSVGALLFSIGAQVRDLHESTKDNPALGHRLQALQSDIAAASAALRESLLALSESSPERALPVELAEHCRSFESRCGVSARFVQLGPVPSLDAERAGLLIATVREGLLNVEKHAAAGSVVVSIGPSLGGVVVVVADDGTARAHADAQSTGIGLRALAERAARLGGRVDLIRGDGTDGDEEGCTLRAWVPDLRRPA